MKAPASPKSRRTSHHLAVVAIALMAATAQAAQASADIPITQLQAPVASIGPLRPQSPPQEAE